MNFQSILNFILSPFGVVILFGVISTMARMFKSAQDQQSKKRAIHQQRLAQRDSLRTGTGSSSTSQQTIQTTAPLQTQASTRQTKKASWDQKQQLRRDRIEQMRQQRIEQLKKLRQKRSGTQSPSPQQTSTPHPQNRPQPRQQPRSQSRPQPQPQQSTATQAYARQTPQPYAQPIQPSRTPRPQQQPARRQPSPQPNRQPSRQTVASAQPVESTRRRRSTQSVTDSQIQLGSVSGKKSSNSSSARAQFRKDMRRSIIAKEILSQPMGLRSPDSQTMGTL